MEYGIPEKKKKSSWEEKAALYLIPALLIAFILFLFCKLQGSWDVSRNYDIRRIQASRDKGNVQAVIDENEETVWGSGNYWEKNKAGDYILFQFAEEKRLMGISIQGKHPDALEILYKTDGDWAQVTFEKDSETYSFSEPVVTDQIKIRTKEEAENKKWKVKEIRFYEEQPEG